MDWFQPYIDSVMTFADKHTTAFAFMCIAGLVLVTIGWLGGYGSKRD